MDILKKIKCYDVPFCQTVTIPIAIIGRDQGDIAKIIICPKNYFSPFGFGNRGAPDTPLRMLVPASVVGAIIGKGGQTVRQITQLKVCLLTLINYVTIT